MSFKILVYGFCLLVITLLVCLNAAHGVALVVESKQQHQHPLEIDVLLRGLAQVQGKLNMTHLMPMLAQFLPGLLNVSSTNETLVPQASTASDALMRMARGYGEPLFYAQPVHIQEKGNDLIHTLLPTILGQQLKEASNLVGTSGLVFDNLLLDKVQKARDDPLKHLIPILFGLLMLFFSKLPTQG